MRRPAARRTIFEHVDLAVRKGEVVVLLGENGAGKTTLLKMLSGLATPDAGSVERHAPLRYCGSGERSFYYRLSIRENLRFFADLLGFSRPVRDARIRDVMEVTGLSDVASMPFSHLSSGMRQRLSIARALLDDPEGVAFDEPTRALDPKHARELRVFIRETLARERGKTIIVASNLLDEARALADRVVCIAGRGLHEFANVAEALGSQTLPDIA